MEQPRYRPGDVVNGHQLNETGTAWIPVFEAPAPMPAAPVPGRSTGMSRRKKVGIGAGAGLIALALMASCGGAETSATTPAQSSAATPTAASTPTASASTPEGKPAPEEKPTPTATKRPKVTYKDVSERALAKIVRDPDSHAGESIVVYGEITQYDSATGLDSFRADVAHRNTTSYGFFDGENAVLTGDEADFEDLIEGDVFRAKVLVLGSLSYDTQIGGSTTVPQFMVTSISRIGNNG